MSCIEPVGFHIEVWREDDEVRMVFYGEAGRGSAADAALAFAPHVCPMDNPITLDLDGLTALASAHHLLMDVIGAAYESGLAIRNTPHLPAMWNERRDRIAWQLHSYELPPDGWTCAFARDRAGELASQMNLARYDIDGIKMAVGEALCNALKHGCASCTDGKIAFRCVADRNGVEVVISDTGGGFDPLCASTGRSANRGGHGIGIMRSTVDHVDFDFENGTQVRLVKRRLQQGG